MKKTTKLLSVILAFVMALSCMSMMASAAVAQYQTVENLTSMNAYSPYGTVTRLSTEERLSILMDALDGLLAPMTNLNMGKVIDNVLGLNLSINLTSVNNIFDTIDQVCTLKAEGLYGFAALIVDLGIVEKLNVRENTDWTKGLRRESSTHVEMVNNLLKLLTNNASVIGSVFDDGIQLGIIKNFIKGLNLGPINNVIKDLPSLINGIVLPLMGRQDDDSAQRTKLGTRTSSLLDVAQEFVNGLFTKPMNWTSYREDAAGNDLHYTLSLPFTAESTSRYFVKNADGSITQYDYKYEGALGSPKAGFAETVTYTKAKEFDTADCTTYVYRAPEGYNGDATLKWYKAGDPSGIDPDNPDTVVDANGRVQSSYWLPTVAKAFKDGSLSLDINGADSVLGLVYKFAPYLFREMATTVLNGSAKKLIAEAFDVKFTKIGLQGEDAVTAEATATGNPDNFFTKAQEYYTWEYSDYKVIGDVPYYRYQNQYFKGEIPNNISAYYYMFNWNWNITDDFMDEFIPETVGSTWALDGLNNLVKKAIDAMIADSWTVKGKTYNRSEVFTWTEGDNSNLLNNLMICARNFFMIAPEEIVDEFYADAQFYEPMMNGELPQAVNGLVCELVKLIMPQIKFSDDIINQPITAIAAVVVRELCTQLMPTYNFDAMIYANYGNASNNVRALASHTADEWLDITLYMGVNLGMYYLRNIADVGEDKEEGYYSAMSNLGALPAITSGKNTTAAGNGFTFTANSYKMADGTPSWLAAIDWIVDWALDVNTEWCWHFDRLVNCGAEVNLTTYQNPFTKINSVILSIIPDLENLLYTENLNGTDYGSGTFLEKVLKDGLVDSIVNLDLPGLLSLLKTPASSVLRKTNIADTLVQLVVNILNSILYKVAGNTNLIDPNTVKSVSTLLNHDNIKAVVVTLIGKLYAASNTYKLLDPILPIANFFIGWTTDPQKYAEPNVYFTNGWNSSYLKSDNSPVMKIRNTSSGMLLTHRNSSKVDTAYTITIEGIDFGDSGITTSTSFPVSVEPGKTTDIVLSVPSADKTVKAVVTYSFAGKDEGKAIGGTQKKVVYNYISSINDQLNENVAAETKDKVERAAYKQYNFTEDIYHAVDDFRGKMTVTVSTVGAVINIPTTKDFKSCTAPDRGLDMDARAKTYFQFNNSQSSAGWLGTITSKEGSNNSPSTDGHLYSPKSSTTEDTFSDENAKKNNLYGLYDMGRYAAKYGNNSGVWEPDFVFYNDYDIDSVAAEYAGYNLLAEDFASHADLFNAYEAALMEAYRLALYPKRIDYVEQIQPQIEPAITALKDAYKALMAAQSVSNSGNVADVEAALAKIETNPDRDLNYQDYALFEYFQYEKQRTAAREMIKSTKGPAAPENHIDSVWGNDLVNAIVAAQTGNVKLGVQATIEEPTAEDENNYAQAVANFRPATYTTLNVEDQVSKLNYYAEFMKANTKVIDKTFLNQEITYAEAQNYDETKYSADSWARYTTALAAAKDAAANSDKESVIFDAKYELMVAQNKLQLKERSMKECGYMNEELIPLIEHANAIIANYGKLYATKDGVTAEAAFAQLVKALGVKYDVTVDEKQHAGILYDYSALTFKEYDRTATAKNKKAVDAAADKLRDAIENFVCTATVTSNNDVTNVNQEVRYIQGILPNSLKNVNDLKAKLTVSSGVTPIYTASKAEQYGTGARVELKSSEAADAELYATYFVVIYGDVNGDGAVDAFDAIEVDLANCTAHYMGDVYDDAADINGDGLVNDADYGAIVEGVKCKKAISQVH